LATDLACSVRGTGPPKRPTAPVDALSRSAVLPYTSRTLAAGNDSSENLAIARTASAALARTVRMMLPARPSWVIAKGGIISYGVALYGLSTVDLLLTATR
jgi:hypothetical protein